MELFEREINKWKQYKYIHIFNYFETGQIYYPRSIIVKQNTISERYTDALVHEGSKLGKSVITQGIKCKSEFRRNQQQKNAPTLNTSNINLNKLTIYTVSKTRLVLTNGQIYHCSLVHWSSAWQLGVVVHTRILRYLQLWVVFNHSNLCFLCQTHKFRLSHLLRSEFTFTLLHL